MAKDSDTNLSARKRAIPVRREDVLDGLGVGDDCRLVVLSAPQVEISIGLSLDLSASVIDPGMFSVLAVEGIPEQEVQVSATEVSRRWDDLRWLALQPESLKSLLIGFQSAHVRACQSPVAG